MKKLKILLLGVLLGAAAGLWIGINIGKNKPIWSNPFDKPTLSERLIDKSGEVLKKGGRTLEKKGEELRRRVAN